MNRYRVLFFYILTSFYTFCAPNFLLDTFYKAYQRNIELPFVVVICSMNNIRWVEKNLDSVFMQKYHNFRVIYIDDASQDGTAEAVQKYSDQHNLSERLLLVRNEKRCRKLKNEYLAFHMCNDHEIIVQLDGDDWYKHDMVLSNLNKEYLKGNIWLTYGTHENFPPSDIGAKASVTQDDILADRLFRKKSFIYMPTRSFFAWLVKQIKLEDFLNDDVPGFEGMFYPVCDDVLMMWAMLEMAHYRFAYLTDVSYVANRDNPLISLHVDNDLLKAAAKSLRKVIPLYPVLEKPVVGRLDEFEEAYADVIVLSENVDRMEALLPSLSYSLKHIDKIMIIFCAKDGVTKNAYQELAKKNPAITCVEVANLASCIKKNKLGADHVVVLQDSLIPITQIDCRECIKDLERTYAYACYFNIQENIFKNKDVPCQHIADDLFAWKFSCDKNQAMPIHQWKGVLYRRSTIEAVLTKKYTNLNQLKKAWQSSDVDTKKVGLFFKTKKIGNIS